MTQGQYHGSYNHFDNARNVENNHTRINNVTVNRSSNTYNRNSYDRGANIHNSSTVVRDNGGFRRPENSYRQGVQSPIRPVAPQAGRPGGAFPQQNSHPAEGRTENARFPGSYNRPAQPSSHMSMPARAEGHGAQMERRESGRQERPQGEHGGSEHHGGGDHEHHR